jgi:hypothetical protein
MDKNNIQFKITDMLRKVIKEDFKNISGTLTLEIHEGGITGGNLKLKLKGN